LRQARRRCWPRAAIRPTRGVPVNVTAALSDQIATVVTVHWTTAVPTTGYVEFGPTGALGRRTAVETTPALDHSAARGGPASRTRPPIIRAVSAENGAGGRGQ
jgi:hypothetical protein